MCRGITYCKLAVCELNLDILVKVFSCIKDQTCCRILCLKTSRHVSIYLVSRCLHINDLNSKYRMLIKVVKSRDIVVLGTESRKARSVA